MYFLQEKFEAFATFEIYKALVEKEVGNPTKVLCIDPIKEYIPQEFANFCEMDRIKRQLTKAYTPQQNGVCKRKNHTTLNMV